MIFERIGIMVLPRMLERKKDNHPIGLHHGLATRRKQDIQWTFLVEHSEYLYPRRYLGTHFVEFQRK
jgi:hypothetical protein